MEYIKGKIFDKSSWEFMNVSDFARKYNLSVDFVMEKKKKGWSTEEIIAKEKIEDTLVRCF